MVRCFFSKIAYSAVSIIVVIVVLFVCSSPASATSVHDPCSVHIDIADYVSNVVVEGDIKTVYYDLPLENQGFATKIQNGIYYAEPFSFMKDSRFETWGISGSNRFPTYPLGRNTTFSVEDMRSGSELVFDGCYSMKGWEMNDPISPVSVVVTAIWFYYDENCNSLGYKAFKQTTVDLTYLDTEYEFTWSAEIPSGVAYVYPRIDIQFDVDAIDTISFNCVSFAFHHDVNMLLDNSQTMQRIEEGIQDIGGKLDDLGDGIYEVKDKLDDIEQGIVGPGGTNDKLDDVTDKLDDIFTGGDSAGELIDGGDKIADAGADLGEDIGQIQDFENQYMGQFEENLDDIINSADLTFLASPLSMIQLCLNKIVASVPSKYLVVFTLPALLGLFMYIVGHPIKVSHIGRGDPGHRSFSSGPSGKGGGSG